MNNNELEEEILSPALKIAKQKVVDALKYQQELPIQRVMEGSPEEQEIARLDMLDRLNCIISATAEYKAIEESESLAS